VRHYQLTPHPPQLAASLRRRAPADPIVGGRRAERLCFWWPATHSPALFAGPAELAPSWRAVAAMRDRGQLLRLDRKTVQLTTQWTSVSRCYLVAHISISLVPSHFRSSASTFCHCRCLHARDHHTDRDRRQRLLAGSREPCDATHLYVGARLTRTHGGSPVAAPPCINLKPVP